MAVLEEPVILTRAPSKGRVLTTVSSWTYPSTEPLEKGENKQPVKSRSKKDSNIKKMTGDGPLSFFIFLKFLINNNNDTSLLISYLVSQFAG
jgi:hypothetical protein